MELIDTLKKHGRAVEKALMPDKSEDMDILDKLKLEHNEVKDLLAELVSTGTPASRKLSLVKQIKSALVPHERAEEKVVYDALLGENDKVPQTDGEEGYLEHNLADKALTSLGKLTDATSPEFAATAKVLKEMLEHHIQEEERNVWRDVKDRFDDKERLLMNTRFEAAKKKVRLAA